MLLLSCGVFGEDEIGTLKSMEEAQLAYPGAVELSYDERPARQTLTGETQAYLVWAFGSEDEAAQIEDWYAHQLEDRGWGRGGSGHSSAGTGELYVRTWERDGRVFRFSVYRREGPFAGPEDLLEAYPALIDVRLFYE